MLKEINKIENSSSNETTSPERKFKKFSLLPQYSMTRKMVTVDNEMLKDMFEKETVDLEHILAPKAGKYLKKYNPPKTILTDGVRIQVRFEDKKKKKKRKKSTDEKRCIYTSHTAKEHTLSTNLTILKLDYLILLLLLQDIQL